MKKRTLKPRRQLCATLYRKDRASGLKRLIFDSEEQDLVEAKMAALGIGSRAYWLSFITAPQKSLASKTLILCVFSIQKKNSQDKS